MHTLNEVKRSDRGRGMHKYANVLLLYYRVRKGLTLWGHKQLYRALVMRRYFDSKYKIFVGHFFYPVYIKSYYIHFMCI